MNGNGFNATDALIQLLCALPFIAFFWGGVAALLHGGSDIIQSIAWKLESRSWEEPHRRQSRKRAENPYYRWGAKGGRHG